MNEGRDQKRSPGGRGLSRVDREEQGDLLADAVTGFHSPPPNGESGEESATDVESKVAAAPDLEDALVPEDESAFELSSESKRREGNADEPPVGSIPESAWEQKMAWAKERAAAGREKEALELYQELVQEDPTSVRALNNLGVLQDEMGDAEGAVATLRAAKAIQPTNQEILGNLGAALGTLGRYRDAEKELRSAFRLDPSNLQVRANLGILLYRRGFMNRPSPNWRSSAGPFPRMPRPSFTWARP